MPSPGTNYGVASRLLFARPGGHRHRGCSGNWTWDRMQYCSPGLPCKSVLFLNSQFPHCKSHQSFSYTKTNTKTTHTVSLFDIQKSLLKSAAAKVYKVAAACGHTCTCTGVKCDVSNASAVGDAIAAVVKKWGRLDVVVANAAIIPAATQILSQNFENDAHTVTAVNLYGVIYTCRAAAATMITKRTKHTQYKYNGKILIIGSIMADMVQPGKAHYTMCKAAARSFGKTLALEVAGAGINVNILQPGHVTTTGLGCTAHTHTHTHTLSSARGAQWSRPPCDVGRGLARRGHFAARTSESLKTSAGIAS